ncbi:ribonuclease H-like domain-containing protein [Tanacetum coccineum]
MKMVQYLTHIDYALWEVITNGDVPSIASASNEGPIPPKTAEQKLARKNELKAKSTLLLAIPDEHLLKFHGIKDAKTLWEAIKARFGGNKELKKMQKTILKKKYINFTASRSEVLDKTYDRFLKLISQLEIHGEVISQEDASLKLLRSLPSAWNNITLIMRNKADLDELSMDNSYNNLKVSKGQASSSTYANDVMFSFFVNQSNSPQLDNEDLEQIGTDDLEEMDVKWQVAMLTMRNYHRRGHFARECRAPRNQGNRNKDAPRRIVLVETPTNALVVQDGICGSSSSSSSNTEHDALKKSNLEIIGYQLSLESLEARIIVHQKNEVVYEEDITFLKYDVQVKDISIKDLKNQLEEALKEKDDLKLKLEKFETSSMKLTKLINSQISVNNKSGVGFDSQMNENELHDCHLNKSEVFESASDSSVNEIEEENNQVNDRFKKVEGYHAVPPPYTGNYMPSRPDLSFAGLDDSVYKTNVSETISSVPRIESTASKSSKDSLEQPKDVRPSAPIIEEWESDSDDDCVIRPSFEQNKPSYAKINFVKSDENTRKSVIEQHTYRQAENLRKSQSPRDCNFYENKMVGKSVLNNMGRVTGQREVRPVWNNAQRVNHQNKLTHPHPKRNFVPTAVATKSGLVPVNAAKQSSPRAAASISTARPVNIAAPKSKLNRALPKTYSYFKAHSPVRRAFNQKLASKTNNFNKKVYTAMVNNVTTFGLEVVVSTAKGKRGNAVKSSACWIWRLIRKVIDHISNDGGSYMPKRFDYVDPQGRLKSDQGIFDSGCSRHMTGNKSYLTDYQDIDGGFVAFAGSPKGGKITGKENSVLFTKTECLVLSPDFKLLDESQVLLKVPRQNNMYSFDLKNVVPSGGETLLEAYLQSFLKMTILMLLVRRESNTKPLVRPSLFSWVFFLATKDETSGILKTFITGIENQINHKVKIIRCDNETEFKNNDMNQFCRMKGIKREFSVATTPQQNKVAKRKNRTLIEIARTMLADSLLPTTFWAEAVNIACYVKNRVLMT